MPGEQMSASDKISAPARRFCLEVANWFLSASRYARFPQPPRVAHAEADQSLRLIRLITRVLFCWILKENGMITGEPLQEPRWCEILADLDPGESSFQSAILRDPFFASEVDVSPLLEIFGNYKFTAVENTPFGGEIALDPEILGLVFENLLASVNQRAGITARKQTGAFYTPRVVVAHMVDEALIAHFKEALALAFCEAPEAEARLRKLFSHALENTNPFDPSETAVLLDAIDDGARALRILDPACGSGAFLIGVLHRLVFLLRRLDPGNALWRERQLIRARSSGPGREAAERAVTEAFARGEGDYARKLYLIKNCIHGVDIDPIAVQIARLRVLLSLLADHETSGKSDDCGALPLPNLESRLVAANALLALHPRTQAALAGPAAREKRAELLLVRRAYFDARRSPAKRALRRRDKALRLEIAALLRGDATIPSRDADQLAGWDPCAANEIAEFFDPEWMFALADDCPSQSAAGNSRAPRRAAAFDFDIVIGNPPYVRQERFKGDKAAFKERYHCHAGAADLYVYFYERSFDLLRMGGLLCFISSNKYFRSSYGRRLRSFMATTGEVQELIDFGDASIFAAMAYPSIILIRKARETRVKSQLPNLPQSPERELRALRWEAKKNPESGETEPPITRLTEVFLEKSFQLPQKSLAPDGWKIHSASLTRLISKLRAAGQPLGERAGGRFHYGIKTGLNEAFVVARQTRDRLIEEDRSSADLLKPYCRGRDVKRWQIDDHDLWLIFARRGVDIRKFPAIREHLEQFKEQLMPGARGGRKAGSYEWYEVQDNVAYWREFETPKIITGRFMKSPTFAYDVGGFFNNNANSIIAAASKALVGILNSLTAWWFLTKDCTDLQNGFLQAHNENLARLPIPPFSGTAELKISSRVDEILQRKRTDADAFVGDLEAEIDGLVAHLYGLSQPEFKAILDELELPDPTRMAASNAYRAAEKGLLE
jgi:adenine-specific DNA-methyltransferase